ncbi:unnamed protein product [Paramecium sonneborni]|uniref:Uncharacterized protein n=1 Tax=Paramecium sonneborni TaxID=65129 RepID=A0A8S1PU12_9CILI|nr:unnamed protein product [Paramecium sonneborni]
MSIFRGFTSYDYGREYFAFFIRRSFDISDSWFKTRSELEKKLQEEKKKPQETFEMESDFGNFFCQYEKSTKCYFILLSNQKTIKEEQQKVLAAIIEQIKKVNNYNKLTREEFQKNLKQEIEDLLIKAEQEYIEKNGNLELVMTQQSKQHKKFRKDLTLEIEKNEQQKQKTIELIDKMIMKSKMDERVPKQKINFKGFMMFDYVRQYFFMMVNKMIPIQKKWLDDRNAIQKQIMDNQKKPLEIIQLKGESVQFYAKYHKEKKCYFILYSDEIVSSEKQKEVLEKIYQLITQFEYIKMIKEEIETKFVSQVKAILNENEKVDSEQVIMKIEEKNNNIKQQTVSPQQQSEINEKMKLNNTGSLNNQHKNDIFAQEESIPLNS